MSVLELTPRDAGIADVRTVARDCSFEEQEQPMASDITCGAGTTICDTQS